MTKKEHFCKYSKHFCPDCGSKMRIIEVIEGQSGASYTTRFEECVECGYRHDITDKRSNNTKIEIVEPIVPEKPWKKDNFKNNRR